MSIEKARHWAAAAIDESDAQVVLQAIEGARAQELAFTQELEAMFSGPLKFGTAGLRARIGAGESQMNTSVVARATWGLGTWLVNAKAKSVVVCYDARKKSDVFAQVTAEVFSAQGLITYLSPQALPTPVLAYAVPHLGAGAGVMITASHNPRDDNGYKVYLQDGCQIAPPVDSEIAVLIEQAPNANRIARNSSLIRSWPNEVWLSYIKDAAAFITKAQAEDSPETNSAPKWVYTPMHGVGAATLQAVIKEISWPQPLVVKTQATPDGQFPTLPFPNPEEEGALSEAIKTAQTNDVSLIVANDPDADRCAIAVRRGETWRQLTGDEVGALLAQKIIEISEESSGSSPAKVLATTLVSSTLTSKMAASHDFTTATTLTGFKWIGRIPGLVYGYEEALGYCGDPVNVKDKDGITAALLAIQINSEAFATGKDLIDLLDEIYLQYGLHYTSTRSTRFESVDQATEIIASLALNPPKVVASLPVRDFTDLTRGWHHLPPTSGVLFYLGESVRVIIRPSGTEPKVKTYLEVVYPPRQASLTADKAAAAELSDRVHAALRESMSCPTP